MGLIHGRVDKRRIRKIFSCAVILLAVVFGGFTLYNNVFASMTAEQQATYDKLSDTRKNLFNKLKIDFLNAKSRVTGTEPFNEGDASNENGVDVSPNDEYIRTHDVIKYTIEVGISPNTAIEGVSDSSNFKGGVIKVRAKLPNQGTPTLMRWRKDAWMQNVSFSEDDTVIYAEYVASDNVTLVNATQNLTFTVKFDGYKKAITEDMAPVFEVWMEGNEPDNNDSDVKAITISDRDRKDFKNLIISGHVNLDLRLVDENYLNFKDTREVNGKTVNGQYVNFGLAYLLYQDVANFSDLRGIEYPSGDITSKLKLSYYYKNMNDVNAKWTLIDENDTKATGVINGTEMIAYSVSGVQTQDYYPQNSRYAYLLDDMPHGKTSSGNRYRGVLDSGNIQASQNGDAITTIQSGYKINGEFPDRGWGHYRLQYNEKYGYFATDVIELFVPYYDDSDTANYNYQVKIDVAELEYSDTNSNKISKNGIGATVSDAIQSNNTLTKGINNYTGGIISHWMVEDYTSDIYIKGDNSNVAGSTPIIHTSTRMDDGEYLGGSDSLEVLNTSIFEFIPYSDGMDVRLSSGSLNGYDHSHVNDDAVVKFGILTNDPENGTNTNEKANAALYEDFTWYDSIAEASKHGTVSAMYGSMPNHIGWTTRSIVYFRLRIKDNSDNTGKTGIIRTRVRAYADKERTKVYYYGGKNRYISNSGYTPTTYYEDGGLKNAHADNRYGLTMLVIGFKSSVTTITSDKNSSGEAKSSYDVQDGEINLEVQPKLLTGAAAADNDRFVDNTTVTTTLPNGLSYKNGSANITPSSVTVNSDGTTTIVWKIDNWQVNHAMPGGTDGKITFTAEISAALENNASLNVSSTIFNSEDLRNVSDRTGDFGVVIANLAGVKSIKGIDKAVVEKNESFTVTTDSINNGIEALKNVRSVEILPTNGDASGSSFSGNYTLTVTKLASGQKMYYATDNVSNIGITKDKYGKNVISGVNLDTDTRWTEVPEGGIIPANATAVATVIASIGSNAQASHILTVNPSGNKEGDVYVFASNTSSDNLSQAVKTNSVIATVVTRNLSGRAFVDINRTGKYDDSDELLANSTVKLLDASGAVVATTTTDSDGKYIFKNVAKGNYTVQFTIPTNYEVIAKSTDNVANSNGTSPNYTELNQTPAQAVINLENVNFGVRIKQGRVITHHYYDGTKTKISADVTQDNLDFGSSYSTVAATDIPSNYEYKSRSNNHAGYVDKDVIEVDYYYQKKNSQLSNKISKTGTEKIAERDKESGLTKVEYEVKYDTTVKDYIGTVNVAITDQLPYAIDQKLSNLDGGTYNATDNTIVWTDSFNVESVAEVSKSYTKKLTLYFLNVPATKRSLTNEATGKTVLDNNSREVSDSAITKLEIPGKIIVHFIDRETNEEIADVVETTDLVGEKYTSAPKNIEGYELVESPDTEDYTYTEANQHVKYYYDRIKLKVTTEVDGEGGTIEGDENVPYGDDSTVRYIRIIADDGYVISKIIVNGEEIEIEDGMTEYYLPNFIDMDEDKHVVVSFARIPVAVVNPGTIDNVAKIAGIASVFAVITGMGVFLLGKRR